MRPMLITAAVVSAITIAPQIIAAQPVTYNFDATVTSADRGAPYTVGTVAKGVVNFTPTSSDAADEYFKIPFIESARYWSKPFEVTLFFGNTAVNIIDPTIPRAEPTTITIQQYPDDSILGDVFDFRGAGRNSAYTLVQWFGAVTMLTNVNLSTTNFETAATKARHTNWEISAGNRAIRGTISNVRRAGVPEPSTWAMMLFGFGLVGVATRRRQNANTAYA